MAVSLATDEMEQVACEAADRLTGRTRHVEPRLTRVKPGLRIAVLAD
jgi:hypothetical protein